MKLKPWAVNLALTIAAMALAALNVPWARAQSSTPREETWITDGPVNAIVRTPDRVYIGGMFNYVGPVTGGGVPLDVTTGAPVATFPRVNGDVYACVPDGSGGWYIGGDFDKVAGVVRNNIAHILANGTVDLTWNPNANNWVEALAVSGSTVYAGGEFTSISGQTRNEIAALNTGTGAATDWDPNASGTICRGRVHQHRRAVAQPNRRP
ncbi:MAG: delta-60 repeat domain-containing protein [Candidatus Sumerlaeota bacterium]|nr:delta-60 repeat domain-containing protein [Candidatus Sumerlaeota bacterium]